MDISSPLTDYNSGTQKGVAIHPRSQYHSKKKKVWPMLTLDYGLGTNYVKNEGLKQQ